MEAVGGPRVVRIAWSADFSVLSFFGGPDIDVRQLGSALEYEGTTPTGEVSIAGAEGFTPPRGSTPLVVE